MEKLLDKLLLSVKEMAAILSMSTRNIYRLSDEGRMPKPVRIGGSTRWRRADIEKWVADGCGGLV